MWDDIAIMGMLPNHIILSLRVEGDIPTEGIVIGGSTGFKLLTHFDLEIKSTSHLEFEVGAMPNLQEMWLMIDPTECDRATGPIGLEHLPPDWVGPETISINLYCKFLLKSRKSLYKANQETKERKIIKKITTEYLSMKQFAESISSSPDG